MIISLVVAASTNNAIGKEGKLLWHLPNDLRFFKNITWAMPVVMGRKTFESIDSTPMKGRFNIILTRQKEFKADRVAVVHNLEDAIFLARENDYAELMVLGGGEIYAMALPRADKLYITRVHAVFENADAFFPAFDTNKWDLRSNQDYFKDEHHAYDYSFQLWERT